MYNSTFFDKIDTELKAYLLGYLVADGCITIEERWERPSNIHRIQFQSSIDDLQVLELIRNTIAPHLKISKQKAIGNRKESIRLRLACKYMVDSLMDIHGIKPRKTWDYEFESPKLPYNLVRHFIRGFFDGDGSVGKGHFSFIFNSKIFLNKVLKHILDNTTNLKYYIYEENRHTSIYYSLHFSINIDSRIQLFNYLYKDCNYKLDRKYNIFYNTVLNNSIDRRTLSKKELLSV